MGPAQHSRHAGTPSTSGRHQVTPRPQNSRTSPNLQLHPKRIGGGYEFIATEDKHPFSAPGAVTQALKALPATEHPYSQYDLDLVAEILRKGDAQVHKELCSGTGSGEVRCSKPQILLVYGCSVCYSLVHASAILDRSTYLHGWILSVMAYCYGHNNCLCVCNS